MKNMLKRLEKQSVGLASPPTCRAGSAGESSLSQSHALGVAQRTQEVTHEETKRKLSLSCSSGAGEEGRHSKPGPGYRTVYGQQPLLLMPSLRSECLKW